MILETRELGIGYGRGRQVAMSLAGKLNLRLEAGKLVGLLGPNGVGKSTLLRTLAGMHAPLEGLVLLRGRDVQGLTPKVLSKRLSIVLTAPPQANMMTGYDLVALGRLPYTDWLGRLSGHDRKMIGWALQAVDAATLAGQAVSQLSDGQRQKLVIARALAQDTDILLLDEPTAFLDLPHRVEIMQLLKSLAHQTDRAILVSTHDLDLALRTCDTLWLMTSEELRAGAPEDLVIDGGITQTFSTAGVTFDERSGSFALDIEKGAIIHVHGQTTQAIWMRRALDRKGYQLGEAASVANIAHKANGAGPEWHLTIGLHLSRHGSIASVLSALEDAQI